MQKDEKNMKKIILGYNPNKNFNNQEFSPLCYDKKVHIRLDDFDTDKIVYGFENKLAYLLTYLLNYAITPFTNDFNVALESFEKLHLSIAIDKCIKNRFPTYDGLLISPNYKKLSYKSMGKLPIHYTINYNGYGSLDLFLSELNISLDNYLFNDNYYLILTTFNTPDVYSKYTNKQLRKKKSPYQKTQLFN